MNPTRANPARVNAAAGYEPTVDPAVGTGNHHPHHAGREALVGGIAGNQGAHFANRHGDPTHTHHPVRDTIVGAGAGAETAHLRNEHQDHKAQQNVSGNPTLGNKISGTVDKVIGELTNNPAKVQEGQMKKGQLY